MLFVREHVEAGGAVFLHESLDVGEASVADELSGVEDLEVLSGQARSDESEKEMANYHSCLCSLFRLLNGDKDWVGRDAVDGEANFDEATTAKRRGDFEIHLVEAGEAGCEAGVEHGSGEAADGGGGLSAAAEAGCVEREERGEGNRNRLAKVWASEGRSGGGNGGG